MHTFTLERGAKGSNSAEGPTDIVVPHQMRIVLSDIVDAMVFTEGVVEPFLALLRIRIPNLNGDGSWFEVENLTPRSPQAVQAFLDKFERCDGAKLPSHWLS